MTELVTLVGEVEGLQQVEVEEVLVFEESKEEAVVVASCYFGLVLLILLLKD